MNENEEAYEQWVAAHLRAQTLLRYALNAAPFVVGAALTAVVWWLL